MTYSEGESIRTLEFEANLFFSSVQRKRGTQSKTAFPEQTRLDDFPVKTMLFLFHLSHVHTESVPFSFRHLCRQPHNIFKGAHCHNLNGGYVSKGYKSGDFSVTKKIVRGKCVIVDIVWDLW